MIIFFSHFIKNNKILIFIIIIGLLYRLYGIYFDYPLGVNAIWDETYTMSYTIGLLQYRNFSQAFGPYPIFLSLLYIPVLILRILYLMIINHLESFDALTNFLTANGMGYFYIISRWYSVFFGTAAIYFVYRISNIIFNNKICGYFSASAYAVSFVSVVMAHWGKAHMAMVFFSLLSLFYALRYEEEKKDKFLYFSVLNAALSISIHYLGISAFIFPLTAWISNWKQINKKIIAKSFFIAIIVIAAFYIPNIKGMSNMFARDTAKIANNNFMGMFPTENFERFYYIWHDSFMVEPVFISLFAVLLLFSLKKIWKNIYARYVLIGVVFNYILMSTVFAAPSIIRWLLFFIILSIILSSGYFVLFLYKIKLKQTTVFMILLILLLPGLFFSYKWDAILNNYTRNEAVEWLTDNLGANEYAYTFDLYIDAPFSYQAAKFQRENNGLLASKKINYIVSHQDEFRDKSVNLLYDMGFNRYEELGGANTKYVIIAYWESGDKIKRYDIPTKKSSNMIIDNVKKYHSLALEKVFLPSDNEKILKNGVDDFLNNPLFLSPLLSLEKSGPFVEVYRVNN